MISSKEVLVSKVIDNRSKELPRILNKTSMEKILRLHFNRIDPELYDILDIFTSTMIEAVCVHLKDVGVKQPTVEAFLNAYKSVNGVSINIGSLRVENYVQPERYKQEIIEQVIRELETNGIIMNTPVRKTAKVDDQELVTQKEQQEEKELEEEFKKYEGVFEDDGKDESGNQKTGQKGN